MPIYEYKCDGCKKIFTIFCPIDKRDNTYECKFCNSGKTRRLVSKVKTVRSEEQLLDRLADPSSLAGIDENDPSSMARWAKKMAREMGENMDDEIDEMAQEEFNAPGPADDTSQE